MKCSECDTVLANENSLKRHNRSFHTSTASFPSSICGVCDERVSSKELEVHLSKKHGISVEHEKLSFVDADAFDEWRRNVETEHKAKYIRFSTRKNSEKTIVYFTCNRSGEARVVSQDSRKRRPKLKGSRKTGRKCTSRITANFFADGTVAIDFCRTHSGHTAELEHLPIPSQVKQEVAAKLASKIPASEILEQVRSSANTNELRREQLITRQDLRNIRKSLGNELQASIEPIGTELTNSCNAENPESQDLSNGLRCENNARPFDLDEDKKKIHDMISSIMKDIKTHHGSNAFIDILNYAGPIVRAAEDHGSRMNELVSQTENKDIDNRRKSPDKESESSRTMPSRSPIEVSEEAIHLNPETENVIEEDLNVL
ncbi:Hypothetical protein NTJ_11753 [Nesidiocoris tenuis]|uniref:C2H2-type domain-containing protein n=1 Tax=Nesidiocoris tenuis TaxID=355587 RepID=A0ABN7B3E9_9HEMI|nr:Hypothetical protein NTJ_11753 [Nesidiocoris tenuis]